MASVKDTSKILLVEFFFIWKESPSIYHKWS